MALPQMQAKIVSIADACLGGLRGRSALLIGSTEAQQAYKALLLDAGMQAVFQEDDASRISALLPQVQLLMSLPTTGSSDARLLSAATIATGCVGRHTPLLIFDLVPATSVEELAGLLPSVCLYTPADLRHVLYAQAKAQIA